ncbi:MAG: AMP-binding protein [bacterium]|nr:AMP-binding protein [bacterium]
MIDFRKYKKIEFLKTAQVKNIQNTLFKQHLNYLTNNSPYYSKLFKKQNININKYCLENISDLPFTDKSDFEKYNSEFLAVPYSKISDIVLSSGTTGKPTKIMYTENDLLRLAFNEEIALKRCGISREDTVLLTCTMDRCFVAGLAYYSGARKIGAKTLRNGLNNFESHMDLINRMKPTAVIGVPSLMYKLGLFIKSRGIDPKETSIRKMICIGEPLRDRDLSLLKIGEYLEKMWKAEIFSTYASSETITTFCECSAQKGGHMNPALAIMEIVNDKGETLPPGVAGEIVMTPLFIDGMPLLRFKTGDISFFIDAPCPCGRSSVRIGPVLGRKKQMIKYCGTTFYPQSINSVLDGIPAVTEYYMVVSSDFDLSDKVKVYVSTSDKSCEVNYISEKLKSHLRVKPEVILSAEEDIKKQVYNGNSRKPVRFIDERKTANEF